MNLLDPVSPYLALIDRIISLVQAGKTRRRDYFEKIVDPLYTQFVPLAEDTLDLFRSAHKALDGPKKRRKDDFEKIRAQRDKFADARLRLRGLLTACEKNLSEKKSEELAAFVLSMFRFFNPEGVIHIGGTTGSHLVQLFNERALYPKGLVVGIPDSLPDVISDSQLETIITSMTKRLEASWFEIAGRYMELKIKNTVD